MKKNAYASRARRRCDYELMRYAAGTPVNEANDQRFTRKTALGRRIVTALLGLFILTACGGIIFDFL